MVRLVWTHHVGPVLAAPGAVYIPDSAAKSRLDESLKSRIATVLSLHHEEHGGHEVEITGKFIFLHGLHALHGKFLAFLRVHQVLS
jgi:hypothetical protein